MIKQNLTAVLVISLAMVACKKKAPTEIMEDPSPTEAASTDHDHDAEMATMAANFQRVQFDFDASSLSTESKAALADNAAIMKAHPRLSVEVQGHADEQGTSEYNLALGGRRAAAVQDYLTSQGISPRRVKTVSYGEEVPLDTSGGEQAWSKNRRAEFRILETDGDVSGTVQ